MVSAVILFAALSLLRQSAFALDQCVTVLISISTPDHLATAFAGLESERKVCIRVRRVDFKADLREVETEVVVDVMFNEGLSRKLQEEIDDRKEVINGNEYQTQRGKKVFTEKEAEMEELMTVLRWTNATRICVVLDEKSDEKVYLDRHLAVSDIFYFVVSRELDHRSLTRTVNKLVKSQGYNVLLMLLHRPVAQQFLQVMDELRMGQNSLTILMSLRSVLRDGNDTDFPQIADTGPLFLIDSGCEGSIREPDYLICKLDQALNSQSSESFSVMNIVAGRLIPIGHIENDILTLTSQWTKSVSNFGISDKPVLILSMNSQSDGKDATDPHSNKGSDLAILHANSDSYILPFHRLQKFPLALGFADFDLARARKQLSSRTLEEFGVAMVSPEYSSATIGIMTVLHELNLTLTVTGGSTSSPRLSDPKVFPMFTRAIMSDAYMSVLYVKMIKHYGWTHVAVLHCDDMWCVGLYDMMVKKCAEEGITIVNDENLRELPVDIDMNSTQYENVFRSIVESKARVVLAVLYGNSLYKAFEGLYDLGMRAGDIVLLAIEWLSMSLFEVEDQIIATKVKELSRGAIQFYPATFVADYGTRVREEYTARFKSDPSNYICFTYDAVMLVAHALDFLIKYGGDYESPNEINKQLRKTRFRGCTGIVTIAEGTNDRAPIMYGILNAQISADGNVSIAEVGTYDPAGLVLFNFTEAIIWPDNTTNVPTDIRVNDIDCPFASKQIVTYVPGVVVAYISLSLMCVVAVVITIVIWRRWWSLKAVELTVRAEISFDDYILYATIGLEALQYATMGPDFPSWLHMLGDVGYAAGLDMEKLIKMHREVFWLVLNASLAGVGLWIVCVIVVIFHLNERWEFFCSKIGDLGEKCLPILGNLCFLPIISTLMNVFQCSDAVDDGTPLSFQSTYLKQDCYQRCWTYPHLPYAVCSVIALFVYLPAAVFLRPAWQNMQPYLHIHTASGFLMLKTIYQLFIIVLNKTLKQAHHLTHAFVFLLATSLFFGFTLIWRPFGYSRPNLWHYISLVCVLWVSILTVLDLFIPGMSSIAGISLFLTGIAVFFLLGIVIQFVKLPAMLYHTSGRPVEDLFRFMFSRGNKYLYIFSRDRTAITQQKEDTKLNKRKFSAQQFIIT